LLFNFLWDKNDLSDPKFVFSTQMNARDWISRERKRKRKRERERERDVERESNRFQFLEIVEQKLERAFSVDFRWVSFSVFTSSLHLNCETNVSNQFKEQSTIMTVVHFRSFCIVTSQPKINGLIGDYLLKFRWIAESNEFFVMFGNIGLSKNWWITPAFPKTIWFLPITAEVFWTFEKQQNQILLSFWLLLVDVGIVF
jgi:hypothetical protein